MNSVTYRIFEQIMSEGSVRCLSQDANPEKLSLEVRAIKKKMVVLPTARESEALPEIALLRDFSRKLLSDEASRLRDEWAEDERLERAFFEDLFEPVCSDIIKARIYTNKEIIRTADALFSNLLAFAVRQLPRQKSYFNSLINTIIDRNADYYKTNGKESTLHSYPFGELLEPDEAVKRWVDSLEVGSRVDCIKTYAGKKNWSRGVVELKDSIIMRVRFVNDVHDSYVQNRYFELAPLGSKETDFAWREGLKVGDLVDYYNFRSDWALYKIVRVSEEPNSFGEPVKTVDIQKEVSKASSAEKPKGQEGGQNQAIPLFGPAPHPSNVSGFSDAGYSSQYYPISSSYFGENNYSVLNRYDHLEGQTLTVKAHSPVLAPPGKFSSKSGTQIDDSEDALFLSGEKKKRFAILRVSTTSGSSSIYLVKYINIFGENGGFDFILQALEGKASVSQEVMGQLVRMIQNASENLVEPFIRAHGEKMLAAISSFILENAEKNLRNLSQQNLMNIIDSVSSLAQRIYPSKKARSSTNQLVVRLGVLCLKSDILEKQFFGAKQLLAIEARTREYDSEISRASLAEVLDKEGIFEKIVKGHPGLIGKGAGVLKLLISEERISEAQLATLWEQIGKTDVDSRTALLGVLKEVLWEFSREKVRFFARKMLEGADEISPETFDLLCAVRKIGWNKYSDVEVVSLVNDVFWQILQSEKEMKRELSKEVIQNFIKSLDADSAQVYVARIAENYLAARNKERNLKLLRSIMKHSEGLCGLVVDAIRDKQIVEHSVKEIVDLLRSKIRPDSLPPASIRRNDSGEQGGDRTEKEERVEELQAEALSPVERVQIQLRLKLFKGFLKHEGVGERLFAFEHFEQIWEVVFATANVEDFIHVFIKEYILSEKSVTVGAKFKSFFNRHYRKLLSASKHEFFKFFVLLFHQINVLEAGFVRRKVKFETQGFISLKNNLKTVNILAKPIEELFGIDAFWELFAKSKSHALFAQLANYLTKVYLPPEFFENENQELYAAEKRKLVEKALGLFLEDEQLKGVKASLVLARIIKAEEKHGAGPLVSLAALKGGERLIVNIEKDTKYLKEKTKINIFEFQTILELKEMVSKEYRLSLDSVLLVRENEEEIPSSENALTLEAFGIRMRDSLIVREAETPEVVEVGLLDDAGLDFSEQTYRVFKEIFAEYSTDGKMSRENLAKFTSNATDGSYCGITDERITGVFEKYDKDKRGFIEEQDFIDFYKSAAIASEARMKTVRLNLQSLGYGKDLRLKRSGFGCGNSNFSALLRFELCNNDQFGTQLLKYIEEGDRSLGLGSLGESKGLESFCRLTELLSPAAGRLRTLIAEPVKTLQSNKHAFIWKSDLNVLHALIFRNEGLRRTMEALGISFGEGEYQAFLAKIIEPNFFKNTLEMVAGIQKQMGTNLGAFELLVPGLRILEKLLKLAVDLVDSELVADLRNFLSFFIKQKKKITEKSQTESPAKKEDEDKKEKGLKPFGEKEKEKDKEKEDEGALEEEQLRALKLAVSESGLVEKLVEQLNFSGLNACLIDLLRTISDIKIELNKFQKVVLKSTMILLISSLRLRDQELSALLSKEDFQRLIFTGLAHEKGLIRLFYKNFYAFLTANSSDVRVKIEFLKILINNIASQSGEDFHSLIELACNILGEIGELKAASPAQAEALHSELNFSELFSSFAEKLLSHASGELAFDDREDNLLIGYLSFMEKIVRADDRVLLEFEPEKKKALVGFLFKSCLFEITKSGFAFQNIKCKSRKSRTAAINLLVQLLRNDVRNTINLIVTGLLPLAKNLPDMQTQLFGLSAETDRKSQLGFLGIKNLGCVCYMIAMLQQFYCTPAFRNGILLAEDGKAHALTEVKGRLVDDNLFHQLQKMFAYLDCSERRDFNPVEFCLSYKDHTGQPVNVMVQQDADEFLKVIFDKLEEALKGGPFIGILNSVFGGKICNVIVCKGCGYEKVNEEGLYNLSLEVKNMGSLKESFEKFVEEEIISEFMCDKCKNKCDISKKALLKALPNVLIVYLKKMVFDLDLLMNIKLHSRYEFPNEINLKKYMHFSKELEPRPNPEEADELILGEPQGGQQTDNKKSEPPGPTTAGQPDDQDFEYKLVGVVIHKGNAEYGHYTSLVNVNRGDPRRPGISKDLWLEFDDYRVSKFDMTHFQEECFGTNEDKEFPGNLISAENHISKSAYILIYDKVKKSPISFPLTAETMAHKERILAGLKDPSAFELGPDSLKIDFFNLKQTLPVTLSAEIEKDNSALVLEQQLLSGSFTNALADIFANIDLSVSYDPSGGSGDDSLALKRAYAEAVLQTLPNYLFKIYCVSNDNYRIGKIVRTIESALGFLTFAKFVGNNKALMASIEQTILNFYVNNVYQNLKPILNALTNSSDQFIKTALTDLVAALFGVLIKNFQLQVFEADPAAEVDPAAPAREATEAYLVKTLGILVSFMPNPDANQLQLRKLTSVFQLLQRLAEQNAVVRSYLLHQNVMMKAFELYQGVDCAKTAQLEKSLSPLLSLIHALVVQLQLTMNTREDNGGQLQSYYGYFARPDLFAKILKEDYLFNNFEAAKALIATMATGNQLLSDQIAYMCLKGVVSTSELDALGFLEALRALLSISDALVEHRLKVIFGVPRLNEQAVVVGGQEKAFVFGLCKESSLKKAVNGYVSPFGGDRGLLEILFTSKDISENSSMLLIYYICELAEQLPAVLAFLVALPPPNYLTAAFYDWFKSYCEHHLRYLSSAYSTYRPEITLLFFNNLPEKLDNFEKKLAAYLQSLNAQPAKHQRLFSANQNVYTSYGSSAQTSSKDLGEPAELFSLRKNYIVGQTNKVTLLLNQELDRDEFGGLKLKVHLLNVALMESRPTGATNLSVPQAFLTYDSYINKLSVSGAEYIRFFGVRDEYLLHDEQAEETDLQPILDLEDPQIPTDSGVKHIVNPKKSKKKKSTEISDNTVFINRDYILRVSLSNKTNENYFVKLNIASKGPANFDCDEFVLPVRSRKANHSVQNLTLSNINGSFRGLTISAAIKKVDNLNMRHYSPEDFSDYEELFVFRDEQ